MTMGAIGGLLSVALLLLGNYQSIIAQPSLYEIANKTSNSWTNRIQTAPVLRYSNVGMRYILKKDISGPVSSHFGFGFFYRTPQEANLTYQCGIILVVEEDARVVWSANQSRGVQYKATLYLTSDEGLTLLDVDGTPVWSTKTKGQFVAGLNLTEAGNLVLLDSNSGIVWQSFNHPTDTLLLGQKLVPGQKLTSRATSPTNDSQGGSYSLLQNDTMLIALLEFNPPQIYFERSQYSFVYRRGFFGLSNGSLNLDGVSIPLGSPVQHVRLDSDGHVRVYDWAGSQWQIFSDVLAFLSVDNCDYPLVCGQY